MSATVADGRRRYWELKICSILLSYFCSVYADKLEFSFVVSTCHPQVTPSDPVSHASFQFRLFSYSWVAPQYSGDPRFSFPLTSVSQATAETVKEKVDVTATNRQDHSYEAL